MIIGIILVVAIIFRLVNINQSLWLDEATQVLLSQKSLYSIFFERTADFHPPLSYVIYHFWMQISQTEIWLRSLSVVFGVLTVYLTYKLALLIFNRWVAITSSLLMAIAPYHIYYSQEIRMYSLAVFLILLSVYFLVLQLRNGFKMMYKLGFILATATLIYTHYMGLFLIIALLTYLFLQKKESLIKLLTQFLIIILLYIPWLPQLIKQLQGGVNVDSYLPHWREVLTLDLYKAVPLTIFKFSIGRIDFENQTLYIVVAGLVLIIFGYLLIKGILILKDDEKILSFWFIIPIILSLVVSVKTPLFQPFRLLFIIPAFYLILAGGIYQSARFRYLLLLVVIWVSLIGNIFYIFNSRFQREDWRGVSNFLQSRLNNDQIKVLSVWPEPFPPYEWYMNDKSALHMGSDLPYSYSEIDKSLNSVKFKEVYLLEYLQDLSDPNRLTQHWLEKNGYQVKDIEDFRGVGFVYHYVKK